jgi:hypothetical protein
VTLPAQVAVSRRSVRVGTVLSRGTQAPHLDLVTEERAEAPAETLRAVLGVLVVHASGELALGEEARPEQVPPDRLQIPFVLAVDDDFAGNRWGHKGCSLQAKHSISHESKSTSAQVSPEELLDDCTRMA